MKDSNKFGQHNDKLNCMLIVLTLERCKENKSEQNHSMNANPLTALEEIQKMRQLKETFMNYY